MKTRKCVLIKFQIDQDKVLDIMKDDPSENHPYGEALMLNHGKLTNIINQLFRARSSNKLMEKLLEDK